MSVSNFIFNYLKNKLPGINWNIGSTIRELMAAPIVTLAEGASSALNEQLNAVTLKTLLQSPEEYKDTIEEIFINLELAENKSTSSDGVVTIFTKSSTPAPVLKNTVFYTSDYTVQVTDNVYPSLAADSSEGNTQLRKLGYQSYSFEVPVSATNVNTYLPINTMMTWDEAPEDVYDIIVTSAISGGRTTMSLEEKLQKIKDYISPEIVSLSDGIAKTLRSSLPDIVADAKYVPRDNQNAVYANTVEHEGINKSYLYVKPLKAPGYEYIEVQGTKATDNTYHINANIVGIIDIIEIYKDSVIVPVHQMHLQNSDVYCEVEYTGELTETFSLKVYRLADADIIQKFLDGYTDGSPFYIEVKAPMVFDLGLNFSYSGQDLGVQDYLGICEYVQTMPLDSTFTDNKLSALLQEYSANIEGTCSYTLSDYKGCCYKQQCSTAVYYSATASSYAIYLGVTNINAKHI